MLKYGTLIVPSRNKSVKRLHHEFHFRVVSILFH